MVSILNYLIAFVRPSIKKTPHKLSNTEIKFLYIICNLLFCSLRASKMKAAPLLFGFVFGSLVVVWIILHSLHPEDKISLEQGICLMILGFIFFISLFDLCNFIMYHTSKGKKLSKKYKLGLYDVMDISNKYVVCNHIPNQFSQFTLIY